MYGSIYIPGPIPTASWRPRGTTWDIHSRLQSTSSKYLFPAMKHTPYCRKLGLQGLHMLPFNIGVTYFTFSAYSSDTYPICFGFSSASLISLSPWVLTPCVFWLLTLLQVCFCQQTFFLSAGLFLYCRYIFIYLLFPSFSRTPFNRLSIWGCFLKHGPLLTTQNTLFLLGVGVGCSP